LLPEAPVATAVTLRRILNVSHPVAINALYELHRAGILRTTSIDRGATAYIATEILDLITHTERAVPARPTRSGRTATSCATTGSGSSSTPSS